MWLHVNLLKVSSLTTLDINFSIPMQQKKHPPPQKGLQAARERDGSISENNSVCKIKSPYCTDSMAALLMIWECFNF